MALNAFIIGSFRNDTWTWKCKALQSTFSTRSASICIRLNGTSIRSGLEAWGWCSWQADTKPQLATFRCTYSPLATGAKWNPRVVLMFSYCLLHFWSTCPTFRHFLLETSVKKNNQGEGPRTERVEVASLPVLLPVRYTVGSAAPGPHLSVWNRFNLKERDKKRYIAIVVILVEWVWRDTIMSSSCCKPCSLFSWLFQHS